jgi:cytochrome c553
MAGASAAIIQANQGLLRGEHTMETKTIETAQDALAALNDWQGPYPNAIACAVLEWVRDAFEHDEGASARDVLRYLETIDCAGCHAPQGLIYNHDIAAKAALWWDEIDEALADYHEGTSEHPAPRHGSITIGWLVWFAVEWVGHDAARFLESRMEG